MFNKVKFMVAIIFLAICSFTYGIQSIASIKNLKNKPLLMTQVKIDTRQYTGIAPPSDSPTNTPPTNAGYSPTSTTASNSTQAPNDNNNAPSATQGGSTQTYVNTNTTKPTSSSIIIYSNAYVIVAFLVMMIF